MEQNRYRELIELIKREVKPALGCTEPIAVALATARSCEELRKRGSIVENIDVEVSANILKNGMGVGIPGTGMIGLHIASALACFCGNSAYGLEVLKELDDESIRLAKNFAERGKIEINLSDRDIKLYISATAYGKKENGQNIHRAKTTIIGSHDKIIEVIYDNETVLSIDDYSDSDTPSPQKTDSEEISLNVKEIYDFGINAEYNDIEFILESEKLNRTLAQEGLTRDYGLKVGKMIASKPAVYGENKLSYAMALAAAASDARMAGCTLPAMSNSGSGNQGITVTMPVVAFSDKLGSSSEQLARALIISHLVAIHIKSYLGRLSALCGCIVASAGSSCGIVYLLGGGYDQVCYAIKNMIGNITGMVCDGAKVGCALKVAAGVGSSVQAAILAMDDICISAQDGIIDQDIEQSIRNLALIGSKGMLDTDRMILDIMSNKKGS